MEAWTVEISSDLDSKTTNLSFEKEFVALAMAVAAREARGRDGGSAWWRIGWPMATNLPHICRSVPCKHESGINFPR